MKGVIHMNKKKTIIWNIIKLCRKLGATLIIHPKHKGEPQVVEIKTKRIHKKDRKQRVISVCIDKECVTVLSGAGTKQFIYTESNAFIFYNELESLIKGKQDSEVSDNKPEGLS